MIFRSSNIIGPPANPPPKIAAELVLMVLWISLIALTTFVIEGFKNKKIIAKACKILKHSLI